MEQTPEAQVAQPVGQLTQEAPSEPSSVPGRQEEQLVTVPEASRVQAVQEGAVTWQAAQAESQTQSTPARVMPVGQLRQAVSLQVAQVEGQLTQTEVVRSR